MRNSAVWTGFLAALVLAAGGLAHAFVGWPAMHVGLEQAGAGEELLGAIFVGWAWGSSSMLAFAAVVGFASWRLSRGHRPPVGALWIVALLYLLFGTSAYVGRDYNPHFLFFVVSGALVALFASLAGLTREA